MPLHRTRVLEDTSNFFNWLNLVEIPQSVQPEDAPPILYLVSGLFLAVNLRMMCSIILILTLLEYFAEHSVVEIAIDKTYRALLLRYMSLYML